MTRRIGPGYICKRCGGPSPIGVGYVGDYTAEARAASSGRARCGCGYSRSAVACAECGHPAGDHTTGHGVPGDCYGDGDRTTGVIMCDCLTYAAPIYAEVAA